MEDRTRRIVDTAVELAEDGGYEAVRLRDIAAKAGVALGTVYKRFRCKEDILLAALERDAGVFEELVLARPVDGSTPSERAVSFFSMATRIFLMKPNLARALVRAMVGGEADVRAKILSYTGMINSMILATITGPDGGSAGESDERTAFLLQQVWFACLVGWMSGLHGEEEIVSQMRFVAERLLD